MKKKLSMKEVRKLWAEALRSGEYKWGKDCLQPEPGKFCCLGVLCELAVKRGVIKDYSPSAFCLPSEVIKWVGITHSEGLLVGKSSTHLSNINDSSPRNPFKRIAKIIEQEPEGLFVQ